MSWKNIKQPAGPDFRASCLAQSTYFSTSSTFASAAPPLLPNCPPPRPHPFSSLPRPLFLLPSSSPASPSHPASPFLLNVLPPCSAPSLCGHWGGSRGEGKGGGLMKHGEGITLTLSGRCPTLCLATINNMAAPAALASEKRGETRKAMF